MAGGKLNPRQKMIGMMYLVLTALLALNVSKEILDSFVVVDSGLNTTRESFSRNVNQLYFEFDKRKSNDPDRVATNWKKAQQAKKLSEDLSKYIIELKKRLLRETEGFRNKEEDTIRLAFVSAKDNYDIPTNIMIGESEDGSKGASRELKIQLEKYRQKLLDLLEPEDRKSANLPIDIKDPGTGELKTWEMRNFYHSPLAATITILSKIENDIKTSEGNIVEILLKKSEGDVIPFDTIAAKVIPQSNYVLLGEEYKADVFIAAFNKTITPTVKAGNYDIINKKFNGEAMNLVVEKGLGKYTTKATREGFQKWGGQISMKTAAGKTVTFDYESEYIVARPALTVANEQMNIMYAGLENSISVSVPGIPSENLFVSVSNGESRKKENGKYSVINAKAGKSFVSVIATLPGGEKRSMGNIEFRVKSLPKPTAAVNGMYEGSIKISKSKAKALSFIQVKYENTELNVKPKLVSYTISTAGAGNIISGGGTFRSAQFDNTLLNTIKNAKAGTVLMISEIKAVGADGITHICAPIMITITN